MKKSRFCSVSSQFFALLLSVLLLISVTACAKAPGGASGASESAAPEDNSTPSAQQMSGPAQSAQSAQQGSSESAQFAQSGSSSQTVTVGDVTVSYSEFSSSSRTDSWQKTVSYQEGQALMRFLRSFPCDGPLCKCRGDYTVTCGGQSFNIKPSEGYVRCGGGQSQLSRAQCEQFLKLVEEIRAAA